MNDRRAVVAEIRKLQAAEQRRRLETPALALPGAILDLVTSCGFQFYAEHDVSDDLRFLDRAIALLGGDGQPRLTSRFWMDAVSCVRRLEQETRSRRDHLSDLDTLDAVRRVLVEVPPEVLLGRHDEESSPDLVCWSEGVALADEVTTPYRCASRISALAYLGAPDRYGVIDAMVALRERYEAVEGEREELDGAIRERIGDYLDWAATSMPGARR